MKIERRIIDREYEYSKDAVIISKTDTKGKITFVSPDFASISGYKIEELLGKPHNIVRHPDMPKSVFKEMWDTIESGKPWHGFVKNLRKNGEYYWVEATILPIRHGNQIVGYISIRKKPTRKKILEADTLYKKINAGYKPKKLLSLIHKTSFRTRVFIFGFIFNLLLFINFFNIFTNQFSKETLIATSSLAILLSLVYGIYLLVSIRNIFTSSQKIKEQLTSFALGNFKFLVEEDYKFQNLEMEKIYLNLQIAMQGIWGTLLQISSKSKEVGSYSEKILHENQNLAQLMQKVSDSSQEEMASLEEISSSIHEIWQTTQKFSQELKEVNLFTENYFIYLDSTLKNLLNLATSSQKISSQLQKGENSIHTALSSMQAILEFSRKIEKITTIIRDIANKTNLLALNASIEAERAGEHGRGFAVVAGEIFKLADETTRSVKEIKDLVQGTSGVVQNGEKEISLAFQDIKDIHEKVSKTIQAISEISSQMESKLQESHILKTKYQQMLNHTHTIENAIQEEKEAITIITKSSENLALETSHLVEIIEEFKKLSQEMKDNSEYVNSLVDHFDLSNN